MSNLYPKVASMSILPLYVLIGRVEYEPSTVLGIFTDLNQAKIERFKLLKNKNDQSNPYRYYDWYDIEEFSELNKVIQGRDIEVYGKNIEGDIEC